MSTSYVQPSLFAPPPPVEPRGGERKPIVVRGREFNTIDEVRVWLFEQAEIRAQHCPLCEQTVRVYKRKLHAQMARALVLIYRFFETHPDEWLDINNYLLKVGVHSGKSNVALLRHWGLIERRAGEKDDGNPNCGRYRITDKGRLFVQSRLTVPKYIRLYNNRLLEMDERQTTDIHSALGDDFYYSELVNHE